MPEDIQPSPDISQQYSSTGEPSMTQNSTLVEHDKAEAMAYAGDEARGEAASMRNEGMGNSVERTEHLAGRIEEWAGVLHEHPVSEGYAQSHPEVNFTALGLLQAEVKAKSELAQVERAKEKINELNIYDIFNKGANVWEISTGGSTESYIDDSEVIKTGIYDLAREAKRTMEEGEYRSLKDRLWELTNLPDSTVGEIREFYTELLQKVVLEPMASRARELQKVAEDVRNGRASQTPQLQT